MYPLNLSQGSLRQMDLLRCVGALRGQFNEIDSTFWKKRLSETIHIRLFWGNNEGQDFS